MSASQCKVRACGDISRSADPEARWSICGTSRENFGATVEIDEFDKCERASSSTCPRRMKGVSGEGGCDSALLGR